jgi:hypothetical protein
MSGRRSPISRLWTLDLPGHPAKKRLPIPSLNALIHNPNIAARIAFYHAAMFSPSLSTWCSATEDAGHMSSWPSITSKQVRQNPPASIVMLKGHLDQQRANTRSTKPKPATTDPDPTSTAGTQPHTDTSKPTAIKTANLFADCQPATGQIYTDPTGCFLVPSTSGNAYMLILYDYDSNYIHVEPMRNRTKAQHLAAYQRALTLLNSRGLRPKLQKLDNEASGLLQQCMEDAEIDYQLVPPGLHRCNAAERAIHTFKNHFIAGLCTTDPKFPLILWDHLLPQALLTLNLL